MSTDGAVQNVTFEAGTNLGTSVDIFWIDHGGNIQFYETLFPGFEFDVSTHVGHGWVGVVDNSCAYIRVYHGLQRTIFAVDEY